MSSTVTPNWLKGLIILFAFTSVATFGLYLYRHSEAATKYEEYRNLAFERDQLRVFVPSLEKQVNSVSGTPSPLDAQIIARRAKLKEIADSESQVRLDVDRLVGEAAVQTQAFGKVTKDEAKRYEQLLGDARARRLEVDQEEERALALERDLDERRLRAREQLEILSRELEQLKLEARNANTIGDTRLAGLERRIAELTQQRDLNSKELRSDGQILASRATDGFVVIDRGHFHHLRKGVRFVVFTYRAGKMKLKGSIEVADVEARIATCRVIDEKDNTDPLVPGDQLHNPVYDPEETPSFVLAGDFTRFSKEELARFIRNAGGRVDDGLVSSSDYLVTGANADAVLAQASNLGITILSEDQLIELVRAAPHYVIGEGVTVCLSGSFDQVSSGKIADFITAAGGRIVGSVEPGVQVLIAGSNAGDDIVRARAMGATVLDQTQFSHLNDR